MSILARCGGAARVVATIGLIGCATDDAPRNPVAPEAPPLSITTASLPGGVIGEAYSAGVDAEGGEGGYFWEIETGALPPGLALAVEDLPDNDVVITGEPEKAGEFDFRLRVHSEDGQSRSRGFLVRILEEPAPIAVQTRTLVPALVGESYQRPLSAEGGDGVSFTWSVAGGDLPPGLALRTDGLLHGTPTAPDTSIVLFRVESGGLAAERAITVVAVANRTGTFELTAAPIVPIPTAIQPHVDAAFARWRQVITGDLSVVPVSPTFFDIDDCGGFGQMVNGTAADDILVLVNIRPIDGAGQVLGQAGPCGIRGTDLPFVGLLTLDADDLTPLAGTSTLTDIIVHEIGHVLGFGSLWEVVGGLVGGTQDDPRFLGAAAVAEWRALGGSGDVPLEDDGGEGTARSHWDEDVFRFELMTGFSNPNVVQPLSRVSIASLADLGYAVNMAAADAYALAPSGAAGTDGVHDVRILGHDEILSEPPRRLDDPASPGAAAAPATTGETR